MTKRAACAGVSLASFCFALILLATSGCGGSAGGTTTTGTTGGISYNPPQIIFSNDAQESFADINQQANAVTNKTNGGPYYRSTPSAADQALALPSNSTTTQVMGMNDGDQIVGFYDDASKNEHPIYWSAPSSSPTALVLPAGQSYGEARNINDLGSIAGISVYDAQGDYQAIYWSAPTATPIVLADSQHCYTIGLSKNNATVGAGFNGAVGGFVWITPTSQPMQLLDQNGTNQTFPEAINSAGTICGYTSVQNNSEAVIWQAPSYQLLKLPLPAGATASSALDINDNGEITGSATESDGAHALLWPSAAQQPIDLGKYVTSSSGYMLQIAGSLLNNGDMSLFGTAPGFPDVQFFMTPK